MDMERTMARLTNMKDSISYYYHEHANIIRPVLKFILSVISLGAIGRLFHSGSGFPVFWYILIVSVIQALVPISVLFYTACGLIIFNLWNVSYDIVGGFVALILACWLFYIRIDSKKAYLVILVPVLFQLKLEYMMPVLLAITVGYSAFMPVIFGTIIYFYGLYTADASALITTSGQSNPGLGLQRIISLIAIDKRMMVVLVSFCLVIFIGTQLSRMFHERAWLFSILVSYLAMMLILLSGKFIFELDYSIWRIFVESIAGIVLCSIVRFFQGVGDVSRMERVTFEDEDYIYYVKAVPKIKVTQRKRNITRIEASEDLEEGADLQEPVPDVREDEDPDKNDENEV